MAGVTLSARCYTLAGVGNDRCFWRSFWRQFSVAGVVFGGLGRGSVKLSLIVVMIPCGRCSTSDDSGSFFVADAILCRS